MGACASRFKIPKDAGGAPPVARELKLDAPVDVVAEDNEAKRQSLGHLFEQFENEKGSVEQPRLDNGPEPESREVEISTNDGLPAKSDALKAEESKAGDGKSKPETIQTLEEGANASPPPRKENEKHAAEIESSVKVEEPVEVSVPKKAEENKPQEKLVEENKAIENPSGAENMKPGNSENVLKPEAAEKPSTDKRAEVEKVSVLDTKKTTEEKPKESPEVKDKQVLGTVEFVEKLPVEKAETQEEAKKLAFNGEKSS